MRKLRLSYIIHLFALAHGIVCAFCALFKLPDTTLLTVMTIVLTVIICTRRRLRDEVTAIAIVIVNLCGFVLGTGLAQGIELFVTPGWISHTVSTIITTELLGWGIYALSRRLPRKWFIRPSRGRIGILIFAILGVFLVRLSLSFITEGYHIKSLDLTPALLTDTLAMMLIIFLAVLLYGLAMHDRDQGHRADLRYASLKNLVNPHFLFNSLNILDGLVPAENAAAKVYIRRLSSLYRYMTVHDSDSMVKLSEERAFAHDYFQLLDVRFPGAIKTSVDIDEGMLETHIVPCSLQILLENAIKHNSFSAEEPLRVELWNEKDWICVRNNIRPRSSVPASTGIGLHYIRTRYQDISERDIQVTKDNESFTVRIPLIP